MMRRQSGFAYIAAVVFLVVIAGIAVALLRLTDTQQTTVNQALLGARAGLTARAGIEWAFNGLAARCGPDNGTATLLNDFSYVSGFRVRVTCSFRDYDEGENPAALGTSVQKRIYRIEAVACNGTGGDCPDTNGGSLARPDYVERARVATICTMAPANTPCEG
ncbi:MSHA biogenesis protein MshP [Massilia sp.]|uniref:MSHA biogenesis protein MshP n=1 Tax=Massilia sp. TaxID=1882437 RepID=UPI00289C1591|nr:MSHA biogenesis protein MshP [Massilia sp.]